MSKIIGVTVGTQLPKPNFNQTDPTKGDYIKNKPDFAGLKSTVEQLEGTVDTLEKLVGDTPIADQIAAAIQDEVYAQNDEPVDAPVGSLWIDMDEDAEDIFIGGGTSVNVYEVSSDSTILDELVTLLPSGTEVNQGDVMLVTNSLGVKAAYQFDETWIACDGNVDASKVIMPFDITLAGSYSRVGNLTKTSTGTATFATKGKSVAVALQEILSKREQPSITSNPAVSLAATSGAYEVGTTVTPEWSASLSAGSYTYGPATGITASAWEISDTDGNTATTASGSFDSFVVGDNTNYRITAEATYGAGAVAVDNLGDPSSPTVQIAAGSKTANGNYITGYRAWFMYIGTSMATIDSTFIRGATNKGAATAIDISLDVPQSTKRIMIAIPESSSLELTSAIGAMELEEIGNFNKSVINVEGVNGFDAKPYNVWVFDNSNGMAATTYKLKIS